MRTLRTWDSLDIALSVSLALLTFSIPSPMCLFYIFFACEFI